VRSVALAAPTPCCGEGHVRHPSTGPKVVWDSPVLESTERAQIERVLTRLLHEALWEVFEQQPGRRGGDDDDAA
jgi:hypothetical protein